MTEGCNRDILGIVNIPIDEILIHLSGERIYLAMLNFLLAQGHLKRVRKQEVSLYCIEIGTVTLRRGYIISLRYPGGLQGFVVLVCLLMLDSQKHTVELRYSKLLL
jgi:hypothetical protein